MSYLKLSRLGRRSTPAPLFCNFKNLRTLHLKSLWIDCNCIKAIAKLPIKTLRLYKCNCETLIHLFQILHLPVSTIRIGKWCSVLDIEDIGNYLLEERKNVPAKIVYFDRARRGDVDDKIAMVTVMKQVYTSVTQNAQREDVIASVPNDTIFVFPQ